MKFNMLKIYQHLFDDLEQNKVEYCIYKGLNHLEEDLNGDRGDIDILINDKSINCFDRILYGSNFKKVLKKNFPFYYFGIDNQTEKFAMIDLDNKIRLGEKPYKPYYYFICIDKLKKEFKNNVWVLDNQDYIPLMFLQRVSMIEPKKDNLVELQKLLNDHDDIDKGYVCKVLEDIVRVSWNVVERDIMHAQDWIELQEKYKSKILKNVKVDYKLFFKQKLRLVIYLIKRAKNKIFKAPSYKIRRKGYLVAFIGVDGAGKSSTVDHILNLDYFKYTGIKRIYFGNNEYWIPGVTWGLNNAKNRWLKMFFALLAHADKSLRSLKAYYYIERGYIVVADRFYYDDFIGREVNKEKIKPTKSILKKIYRKIFEPRVWIQPDLTIFLDVSPDVAYRRKQDFSYETMLMVNKAYKNYMPNVDNVVIVDADENQEYIYSKVVSHMLKLDNR